MNKIWEYRGREYPFDITSDSCCVTVGNGLRDLRHELEGDETERLRVCRVISGFFDKVFGSGEGCAICGMSDSAEEHISAYISFIGFLCGQIDEFSRIREELVAHI